MNSFKNRSIAATAAMIATMITVAAAAPARAEPVSVAVAYGDLDITTAAGAATLAARIRRAADTACGRPSPSIRFQVENCRRTAVANAQAGVRMAAAHSAGGVAASR